MALSWKKAAANPGTASVLLRASCCRVKRCACLWQPLDGPYSSYLVVLCNAPHTLDSASCMQGTLPVAVFSGNNPSAQPPRPRLGDQRAIGHHPCLASVAGTRVAGSAKAHPFPFDHGPWAAPSPLLMTGRATVVPAFLVASTRCPHLLPALPPSCILTIHPSISPFPPPRLFNIHPATLSPPSVVSFCTPLLSLSPPPHHGRSINQSIHQSSSPPVLPTIRRSNDLRHALRCRINWL
jgi:hypothetical protein